MITFSMRFKSYEHFTKIPGPTKPSCQWLDNNNGFRLVCKSCCNYPIRFKRYEDFHLLVTAGWIDA